MAENSDPFLRSMGVTAVGMRYVHHSTIDWESPEYVNIHATIRNPSSNGKGIDDAYVYTFSSREKIDGAITTETIAGSASTSTAIAAANSQLNNSFPFEDTDDDDCIDTSMHTIIEQKEQLHSSTTQVNESREEKSRDPDPSSSSSSSSVVGRGVMGDRQKDVSRVKHRATNERLIHAVRELYKTGEVPAICHDMI